MFTPKKHQPFHLYRVRSGFTLIEILVTMSIILILAGIVIGVQRGVYRVQSEAKAKGEMQAIATALESYKLKYGDYPWIGDDANGQALFDHLNGEAIMTPTGNGSVTIGAAPAQRPLVEVSKFSLTNDNNHDAATNAFIDPWGNPYRYYYKDSSGNAPGGGNWNYPGFILVSVGPDGQLGTDPGFTTGDIPTNADAYFDPADGTGDNFVHGLEF